MLSYHKNLKLGDFVAILKPVSTTRLTLLESEHASISSLPAGLVGTMVKVYDRGKECQYLVKFADSQGLEYAMVPLKAEEILVLH